MLGDSALPSQQMVSHWHKQLKAHWNMNIVLQTLHIEAMQVAAVWPPEDHQASRVDQYDSTFQHCPLQRQYVQHPSICPTPLSDNENNIWNGSVTQKLEQIIHYTSRSRRYLVSSQTEVLSDWCLAGGTLILLWSHQGLINAETNTLLGPTDRCPANKCL